jgi:hypothetical protein
MPRMLRTVVAAVTCISITAVPMEVMAQSASAHLKDPCQANILGALGDLGGGDSDHIYTDEMVYPNVPPQLYAFANATHKTRNYTVMAVPLDNQEYTKIFKTGFISGDDAAQVSLAKRFADSDNLTGTSAIKGRSDFQSFVNGTDGQFIILAGHNENGKFVFYGGDAVPIPLLSEDCARAVKICVFVACKSKDYLKDGSIGVSRDLSLAEGVWMATKARHWLAQQQDVSVVQLAAYMRTIDLYANFRFNVSYFAMAACATAGTPAVAYLIVQGAQPGPPPQQKPPG